MRHATPTEIHAALNDHQDELARLINAHTSLALVHNGSGATVAVTLPTEFMVEMVIHNEILEIPVQVQSNRVLEAVAALQITAAVEIKRSHELKATVADLLKHITSQPVRNGCFDGPCQKFIGVFSQRS